MAEQTRVAGGPSPEEAGGYVKFDVVCPVHKVEMTSGGGTMAPGELKRCWCPQCGHEVLIRVWRYGNP